MGYRETQKGVMAGVRTRLGRPPLDVLTNEVLFEHLLDEEEHMNTLLKLTSQKWIVRQVTITVDKEIVTISDKVPNYGRADIVETKDNGAPDYRRREVDIIDLQDLNLHWGGSKPIAGDSQYPWIASHVAFYYDEETQLEMARFVPPATQSAQYTLYYQPAATEAQALLSRPGFPLTLFYNLLKVNTSTALLGLLAQSLQKHGMWNKDVFKKLEEALYNRKEEYNEAFQRYILQDSEDQAGYIQAFNQSRRVMPEY